MSGEIFYKPWEREGYLGELFFHPVKNEGQEKSLLKATDSIMLLSEARIISFCINWIGFEKHSPVSFVLNKR